jgi:hypothetical protein
MKGTLMLTDIEIHSARPAAAALRLRAIFPGLSVHLGRAPELAELRFVTVPASLWRASDHDPSAIDVAVARVTRAQPDYALRVLDDAGDLPATAVEIVTRCQRHLGWRNSQSSTPLFETILARHRALHDLTRPLVAADHEHALDTWRWVLRLSPGAGLAVQTAALFHDVERLVSESEVRVEQHAPDYAAFKDAHARAGAALAARTLADAGVPGDLVARVADLVATHERPSRDPEKTLLNEADALSFFSLNAPGFAAYYGPAHTARKVAFTLARLGARGLEALRTVRHRADIAALISASAEPPSTARVSA